jgi:hypothetical protein
MFNILALSVSDKGSSRNVSCAPNFDIYVCIAEYFPFEMDFSLFKKNNNVDNNKCGLQITIKTDNVDSNCMFSYFVII